MKHGLLQEAYLALGRSKRNRKAALIAFDRLLHWLNQQLEAKPGPGRGFSDEDSRQLALDVVGALAEVLGVLEGGRAMGLRINDGQFAIEGLRERWGDETRWEV